MQLFRDYEDKYGVVIRSGWIYNSAAMNIGAKRTLITYNEGMPSGCKVLAVSTMIEVLEMGWHYTQQQFRFRYPLPADTYKAKQSSSRSRRDYRIPERYARWRLCPDELIARAVREEWETWQLMEACGLDEESCRFRVKEWEAKQQNIILLARYDWDAPIPF